MRFAAFLAASGAAVVSLGVGFIFWPAGLVCAGVELVLAGYVAAYIENARKAAA